MKEKNLFTFRGVHYRASHVWTLAKYLHLSNCAPLPFTYLASLVKLVYRSGIFKDLIQAPALPLGCQVLPPSLVFLQDNDIFCEDPHISQQLKAEVDSAYTDHFLSSFSPFSLLFLTFILASALGMLAGIKKVHQNLQEENKSQEKPPVENNLEKIAEYAKSKQDTYHLAEKLKEVPESSSDDYLGLKDPSTGKLMEIPCLLSDGYLYDYQTAKYLFENKKPSPLTGRPFVNNFIIIDQNAMGDIITLSEGKELPKRSVTCFLTDSEPRRLRKYVIEPLKEIGDQTLNCFKAEVVLLTVGVIFSLVDVLFNNKKSFFLELCLSLVTSHCSLNMAIHKYISRKEQYAYHRVQEDAITTEEEKTYKITDVPERFLDPITQAFLEDPVTTVNTGGTGLTYSRGSLIRAQMNHNLMGFFRPNYTRQKEVEKFKQRAERLQGQNTNPDSSHEHSS